MKMTYIAVTDRLGQTNFGKDVPVERLYKIMWIGEKAAIKAGFGIKTPVAKI